MINAIFIAILAFNLGFTAVGVSGRDLGRAGWAYQRGRGI